MTGATGECPPPARDDRRTIWTISIVGGLIASAFFGVFLQPILTVISNVTVNIVGTFYEGYIDSIYKQATMKPADQITFLIFPHVAQCYSFDIVMILEAFSRSKELAENLAEQQDSIVRKTMTKTQIPIEEIINRVSILHTRLTFLSIAFLVAFLAVLILMSGSRRIRG
jgi:hypothetical protein